MPTDSKILRKKLLSFGLSDRVINAAWPEWWSEDAEKSLSAGNELRFTLARKLGLDPRSLLEEGEPRFVWRDEAKFKNFSGESDFERAAITSFGIPIARALIQSIRGVDTLKNLPSKEIRESILKSSLNVGLKDLISLCWALGIPVVSLKVFPLLAKRMSGITVNVEGRYAILIGRESKYPAQIAYYLAHELGHIMLGHLKDNLAVVELDDILTSRVGDEDKEEQEADRFALEVLTGRSKPLVLPKTEKFLARDLANKALEASKELHIEPGTLALCLGHSTGQWGKAIAAMKFIYSLREPLWKTINTVAVTQIDFSMLSEEFSSYVHTIMGYGKDN